jgi:CDP-2,3-bis-(O-geranylgeranyl)-sn-glycerol synthase
MGEQLLESLISALVYVLPAYVANGAPVVLVRAVERPRPLDMGRNFIDGRRILGDLLPGTFRSPLEPVTLSSGAMLGDILGSFAKRRIGISQGGPLPVVDQTGFLAAALLLAWTIFGPKEWTDASTLLLLFLVTALLHLGTNAGAYLLGLKERWY